MASYSVYQTKKDSTIFYIHTNRRWCENATGKFEEANNLGTVNQSNQTQLGLSLLPNI
jgi:hypothetical protein